MQSFTRGIVLVLAMAAGLGLAGSAACIASAPTGIHRQTDDDGGLGGGVSTTTNSAGSGSTSSDPHAVLGADPTHGPFTGGQRVLVRGNGFTSGVRVWFGDTEVDPSTIVPIDSGRVQVVAPPGLAGAVDISAQNSDDASTHRTLAGGYVYDALYAVPSSGPISGGTTIEIVGQNTNWDATTVAKVDQKPCTTLVVENPELLSCTVPPGTPGGKTVSVSTGSETILVLDAYTYEDSENGYRGGLSGAPIAGKLKVLIYDNFSGDAIPGAYAIVGSNLNSALVGQADSTGVVVFEDPTLDTPKTLTVAAMCHSPISFVNVPVDTATVYLDPVLTPDCGEGGDPPPVGGKPGYAGAIRGELVWDGETGEFKKADWQNVPLPKNPNEHLVAYVFLTTNDPLATFQLPTESAAVTPSTDGERGYQYTIYAAPGNRALYALAGIENRSVDPPLFTAYVMGSVKGVPVLPNLYTDSVYINMVKTLDHALNMSITAPVPGPKGPDRIRANVSVRLGNDGYAILPVGSQSPLIPFNGLLSFVGVPPLDGDLYGAQYSSSARAVTGPTGLAPMSVVAQVLSTTTSQAVAIGDFIGVPTLVTPAVNASWDGSHLATTFLQGSPIDISVYDIVSGNGLIRWTVAVPQGSHSIELPDIRTLPIQYGALPSGSVAISVYGARIDNYNYGKLLYRHLRPQGMSAYSLDTFSAHL